MQETLISMYGVKVSTRNFFKLIQGKYINDKTEESYEKFLDETIFYIFTKIKKETKKAYKRNIMICYDIFEYNIYIGLPYSDIKDNETGLDFKGKVQEIVNNCCNKTMKSKKIEVSIEDTFCSIF